MVFFQYATLMNRLLCKLFLNCIVLSFFWKFCNKKAIIPIFFVSILWFLYVYIKQFRFLRFSSLDLNPTGYLFPNKSLNFGLPSNLKSFSIPIADCIIYSNQSLKAAFTALITIWRSLSLTGSPKSSKSSKSLFVISFPVNALYQVNANKYLPAP